MLECAKLKSSTNVQLEFRKFLKVTPRKVPHIQEFQSTIDSFQKTGNVTQQKLPECPKTSAEKISAVKTVLDFWFWSHDTERATEVAFEMDPNVVRASMHHLLRKAHTCRECNGAAFQYKVK